MDSALLEIGAVVQRASGIALRPSQRELLLAALGRVAAGSDPEAVARRLRDPDEAAALLAALLEQVTVKETYFLRESERLAEIAWPELFARAAATGEDVRVWSAGCATGEEPYTLALLAREAAPDGDPPVRILATDLSSTALERARQGGYRPRSTRELDDDLRRRYFVADGETLSVGPELRRSVVFATHNLARDPCPPPGEATFDLIVCRNVLIYFDRPTAERVIAALEGALRPSGMLVLGAADALSRAGRSLRALSVAHREGERSAAGTGPRVVAPPPPRSVAPEQRSFSPPQPVAGADPTTENDAAAADFLAGIARLEAGDPGAAVTALRRALYEDAELGLAAFQLGRAYELLGDLDAARRSYERALRTCGGASTLEELLLEQVEVADVLAAARVRLDALAAVGVAAPR